jgi:hypothetical protein
MMAGVYIRLLEILAAYYVAARVPHEKKWILLLGLLLEPLLFLTSLLLAALVSLDDVSRVYSVVVYPALVAGYLAFASVHLLPGRRARARLLLVLGGASARRRRAEQIYL